MFDVNAVRFQRLVVESLVLVRQVLEASTIVVYQAASEIAQDRDRTARDCAERVSEVMSFLGGQRTSK